MSSYALWKNKVMAISLLRHGFLLRTQLQMSTWSFAKFVDARTVVFFGFARADFCLDPRPYLALRE
jgi:hypothetical protein